MIAGAALALNFLSRLRGVASAISLLVASVAHTKARVVCTPESDAGLRWLEKYAVGAGGGSNHRFGVDDAVLDNHVAIASGVAEAIRCARVHDGISSRSRSSSTR